MIEEEGYQLKTFPVECIAADEKEGAPVKIKDFTPELTNKELSGIDNSWHVSN